VFGAIDEPAEGDVGVVVEHSGGAAGAEDGEGVFVGEKVAHLFQESSLRKRLFPFGGAGREDEGVGLVAIERVGA
jgi:hypothetical protein